MSKPRCPNCEYDQPSKRFGAEEYRCPNCGHEWGDPVGTCCPHRESQHFISSTLWYCTVEGCKCDCPTPTFEALP